MKDESGVYAIVCLPNNKVYIGGAVNLWKRWHVHRSLLKRGEHYNAYLQFYWEKYGPESFEFRLLEPVLDLTTLVAREQYWIDFCKATNIEYGFNFRKANRALAQIMESGK